MLQELRGRPQENGPSQPDRNNPKQDILKLLFLKQGIHEYETEPPAIEYTHRTGQEGPLPRTQKPPRKVLLSRTNQQQELKQKQKTQSERTFKKREAIEASKKELMNSVHFSTRKRTASNNHYTSALNERFSSIQMKQKKQQGKEEGVQKRASTISYSKIKAKVVNDSSSKFCNQAELRLQTLLQHRNRHQLEKSALKEADDQHQNIEDLVNQIRNAQEHDASTSQPQPPEKQAEKVNGVNGERKKRAVVLGKREEKGPLKGLLKERYQIVERIGKGLSGEVYKGKDILSDKTVAIKVSELDPVKESEYEFYKKVQHKNIVNYLNNFTSKTKRFLVLEYLPLNLEALSRKRKLNETEIKQIFRCMVSALMFLHGMSIAHRDIKLENVVCSQDLSLVKFIDFGLCIDISQAQQELSRQFCGTVSYMSPQILERRPYDPRKADIWSLGVLLYKLCFDRFPYRGRDERETLVNIGKARPVFPERCSGDLKHLLSQMLRRDVRGRLSISGVIEHPWLL